MVGQKRSKGRSRHWRVNTEDGLADNNGGSEHVAFDQGLSINKEEIAFKVIDGEAIVINLANGIYYSAAGTAAFLWAHLATGRSIQEVTSSFATAYGVAEEKAQKDVLEFVTHIVDERLATVDHPAPDDGTTAPDAAVGTYTRPELVRYDDMSHFFALDPPLPALEPSDQDTSRD